MSTRHCVTIAVGASVLLLLASTAYYSNRSSQLKSLSVKDGDGISSDVLSDSASASSLSITRLRQRRQDDATVADPSTVTLSPTQSPTNAQECLRAIDADGVHCRRRVNDCWQNDECTTATSTSLWNVSRAFLSPTLTPSRAVRYRCPCRLYAVPSGHANRVLMLGIR